MNDNHEGHTEIYITTRELMSMLTVSRSTVHRMMKKGLPHVNVGPNHRFNEKQVLNWLKEKYGGTECQQ